MDLYNAYRRGLLTQEEYSALLKKGYSENSPYFPVITQPETPVLSNDFSGTTTSTLIEVLSYDCSWSRIQNVAVNNTGMSNSMLVVISYYLGDILVAQETASVLPNTVFSLQDESACTLINISVQDSISNLHTTFTAVIVIT